MREPIKPRDIQHGDLIRWESAHSETAREFRQTDPNARHTAPGNYFLLDRPTPAVDLPTEPTLGWVSCKYGRRVLGTWERYESSLGYRAGEVSAFVRERDLPLDTVSKFEEATAVPTEALDRLREKHAGGRQSEVVKCGWVNDFLAAVDAANGDHA